MKVIGETNNGYIAEFSKTEIEKFLGLYYGKMDKIIIGDEIDLGKGHDHHTDICRALTDTQEFIKSHEKIVNAIISGLNISVIEGGKS